MAPHSERPWLSALVLLSCLGCQAGTTGRPAPSTRPAVSRAPRPADATPAAQPVTPLVVTQRGQKTRLTGLARLIANPGGTLLGDQGGAILSNGGGGVLSDRSGGIISNNGGVIISNNGAHLADKTGFQRLLQAGAGLGVYALADAKVRLHDAAGRLLVDEAGQPLEATTGTDARYTLEAVLPPGNLVARIRLWEGGELTAIVARSGAAQASVDLTTATSLGASYVLGLAKGQQAILDKLPATESARLVRELDAVRGFAQNAFKHDAATLDAVTAGLRTRVPAVDKVAEDIKALLLGQARLGSGRQATEVPLGGPSALLMSREGELLIGEYITGRLRRLLADGSLATLMDSHHGTIKANLVQLSDALLAPDGAMYLCGEGASRVYRLRPGAGLEPCLGSGGLNRGPVAAPLEMEVLPRTLALGPDGTLWVGEGRWRGPKQETPPRLLGLHPDGTVTAHHAGWSLGQVTGLATAPDGSLWVVHHDEQATTSTLYRFKAGTFEQVHGPYPGDPWSDVAVGPNGTVYLSAPGGVSTLTPEGGVAALPEFGPGNALELTTPGRLFISADGTLHVADTGANMVAALPPEGPARIVAGTRAVFQSGEGAGFAINGPGGLTVDGEGRLLIAENGSHTIRAFEGASLRTVAGTIRGLAGDGGAALEAKLDGPRGLAWREGALWVADADNMSIRRIDAAGHIETVVGGGPAWRMAPGSSHAAGEMHVFGVWGLAVAPDGAPWWVNGVTRQVLRLDPATQRVHHVAGWSQPGVDMAQQLLAPLDLDPARLKLGGPLGITFDAQGRAYVADTPAMAIYRLTPGPGGVVTVEPFAGRHVRDLLPDLEAYRQQGWPDDTGKQARDAVLLLPGGLAFDAAGNLIVGEIGTMNPEMLSAIGRENLPLAADTLPPSPARIRKIAPDGTITTIAGPGGRHFADPQAEGALVAPTGLAVLPDGRLAIADTGSNLVHILPAGSY